MNERSAGEAFCKSRVALFADAASPFQVVNRRRLPLPADVAAFAAVAEPSERALRQLGSLLTPGESVWLIGENYPRISELASTDTLPCLQMALAAPVAALAADLAIEPLNEANAAEMVALTALAFPGFFRRRTCEMGSYYGVRCDGELIAMGGERLRLDGYAEISGVCTHPSHRGRGWPPAS